MPADTASGAGGEDFVIFTLRNSLYGMPSGAVLEIVQLPALSPLEEAPNFIAGVVNLRGNVLPVINLDIHFGHAAHHFSLDDRIIITRHGQGLIGVIVDDVLDVSTIRPHQREALPEYGADDPGRVHFITDLARTRDGIVMLMDAQNLMQYHPDFNAAASNEAEKYQRNGGSELGTGASGLFADASDSEREILHQRARDLAQDARHEGLAELTPLAVVEINQEYFGMELALVHEFAERVRITPVPCTPSHIVGNTNLRGDVLTVTDIRPLLNMPQPEIGHEHRIVVLSHDGMVAGVRVDDVHDVLYVPLSDLAALPTAIRPSSDEFLKGTIKYRDHVVSVIDLHRLLAMDELVIDEEI